MPWKCFSSFVLIALLLAGPWASASRFTRGAAIHRLYMLHEIEKLRAENDRLTAGLQMKTEQLRNDWTAERNAILKANGISEAEAGKSLEALVAPWLGTYITYTSDFSNIQSIVSLYFVEGRSSKSIVLDRWNDGQVIRIFEARLEDLPSRILDPEKSMEAKQAVAIVRHGEIFGATVNSWKLSLAFGDAQKRPRMLYEIENGNESYLLEIGTQVRFNDRDTRRQLKALDEKEFERGGVLPTQFINGRYENPPVLNPCIAELTPTK